MLVKQTAQLPASFFSAAYSKDPTFLLRSLPGCIMSFGFGVFQTVSSHVTKSSNSKFKCLFVISFNWSNDTLGTFPPNRALDDSKILGNLCSAVDRELEINEVLSI